ncbi:hypothetical protein EJ05DRAFT_509064 [Pseudovirgaria hyperparasitica]|uniref:Uncharacterized protein n=1 Tax=Pseudovirgaria hyperparasitica TaxID=470096 RepID=A0A6A6WCI2_9PEZI|nr:uncharacterized protein EJ05DRAFT_509064 [Pseudovirgaria hyperparasitica]KAF2760538.1 hypothetical protein EJ05DRAFT_509064 [Pseudovirgaria hyperparasitica]
METDSNRTSNKTFHTSFTEIRSPTGKLMKRSRTASQGGFDNPPRTRNPQAQLLRWVSLSWISSILALVFLALTSIYASSNSFMSKISFIGSSPSNTILVLRVLSEIAGVTLAAAIAGAFEKLQFILVTRRHHTTGFRLTDYLALEAGTGMSGLLAIMVSYGVKHAVTRGWSLLRITAIVMVPILNVLIMSNVETTKIFRPVHEDEMMMGYGIGTFNASLAAVWAPMTDLLFATRFSEFLLDTTRAIEVPTSNAVDACTASFTGSAAHTCEQTYYVPGGIENYAAWLLSDENSQKADSFMAVDQSGFIFDFLHGAHDWTYDHDTECKYWGVNIGAFALCIKNDAAGLLQAKLVLCDGLKAGNGDCLTNRSWMLEAGWKTSLRVSLRPATVAYSRLNGTILSYEFSATSPAQQTQVLAPDLLSAFDVVFNPVDPESFFHLVLSFLEIEDNRPVLPLYVWWWFHGLNSLAKDDPAAESRAVGGLQSLLSLPIYHCQAKDFAELRTLGFDNSTAAGAAIMSMFPEADRDTPIYPSVMAYDIHVSRTTLLAYVALSALSLVFCFGMLIWALLVRSEREVGYLSLYPTLNFRTKCEVWERDGTWVPREELVKTGTLIPGRLMRRVGDMRVRLAAGGMGLVPGRGDPEMGVRGPVEETK